MTNPINIDKLVIIMDELREQCPWDKKQTIHSLRQQTIEETFELADAITDNNWKDLKEELGDLLLHVIFYSKIANEKNEFTFQEVIDAISAKLIKRHPHIYGNVKVNSEEDVKRNWEQIKLSEGKKSVLSGVPRSLPAMVKAMRIQEKVKQVGFEWATKEEVWDKVIEEQNELAEAVASGNKEHMEEELGDLFFSIINYSRFLKVDAENALELTNKKFMKRFSLLEKNIVEKGLDISKLSLKEMDEVWNEIKKQKE